MKLYKRISVYLLLACSLIVGFVFQENSSGGGKVDYGYIIPFIENFSINFESGFRNYVEEQISIIHSPVFYIITSFFLNLTNSLIIVKILYLLICISLPFIFFKILKEKINFDSQIIFYFSLIIFFSPYYRSSAIWLLGDNLSLIFLGLSIFFFLRFENKKKIRDLYFSVIFLIFCCYIRYYYCLFYLYYLIYITRNLNFKVLLNVFLLSLILSLPAFVYFFYVITNFQFLKTLSAFGNTNYLRSSLIVLSILSFYLFPFIIDKKLTIIKYYKKNYKILLFISGTFIFIYFLDSFFNFGLINFPSQRGGGIFIKLTSFYDIEPNLPLLFLSIISMLILDFLFKNNRFDNYFLLIILVLSLPFFTIFQKYLDPLFFLLFFGLVKSSYLIKILRNNSINLTFIFIYFSSFYIFSLIYYLK